MAKVTVFGAGAMGTAIAMHLARSGNETTLWASEFDRGVMTALTEGRKHPALPAPFPESLTVTGPEGLDAAAEGIDLAVMGAHSGGARTLARIVMDAKVELPTVVGIAKGLEADTLKRMSEVYAEEVGHPRVVGMGGPCLAGEIALGLPTAAVFASDVHETAERSAVPFRSETFHVLVSDDLVGLEYCTVGKNVAAIGMGILDGMGKVSGISYSNAKAALFTQAFHELVRLVVGLGGKAETVAGLAGLGDTLVTSLGGRNRLFGELLGEGADPEEALADLSRRGMTVEGVDSARDIGTMAERADLHLPFFDLIHRILFEGEQATDVVDCLEELTS
jgi:glycerol-3-phosphate dehydrogenase (NAD(P)+)